MEDILYRALNKDETIRYMAVTTTNLVQEAVSIFNCAPTSAAALGRLLSVTLIMGSELKSDQQQIVTQINGGGEAGTLMAIAKGDGSVKGFISNPNCYEVNQETGKLDVGKIVGTNGYLSVSKESYNHEPFVGKVQLQNGEIGQDFAYYFALSEQIPSVVSVGVLVNPDGSILSSGALIIQLLPGYSEDDLNFVELISKTMQPISSLIANGLDGKAIIESLDSQANIVKQLKVKYQCDCSVDKFYQALVTLPKHEVKDLIEKDGQIEMNCQFCGRKHVFSRDDLKDILNED